MTSVKLFHYLRVFDKFANLVHLVAVCVNDLKIFVLFFFIVIFSVGHIQMILGEDITMKSYVGLDVYNGSSRDITTYLLVQTIKSFNNAIGQVSMPVYSYWTRRYQKSRTEWSKIEFEGKRPDDLVVSQNMIIFIWVFWVITIFFINVILLNFMIALISQSYEKVISRSLVYKYQNRSEMNREFRLLNRMSFKPMDCLIIFAERMDEKVDDEDDKEWNGFVSSVNKFLKDNLYGRLETAQKRK